MQELGLISQGDRVRLGNSNKKAENFYRNQRNFFFYRKIISPVTDAPSIRLEVLKIRGGRGEK